MLKALQDNHVVILLAAYWLYSAAVSSMPEPITNGSAGYKWLYGFLHTMAGNLDKVASNISK